MPSRRSGPRIGLKVCRLVDLDTLIINHLKNGIFYPSFANSILSSGEKDQMVKITVFSDKDKFHI